MDRGCRRQREAEQEEIKRYVALPILFLKALKARERMMGTNGRSLLHIPPP